MSPIDRTGVIALALLLATVTVASAAVPRSRQGPAGLLRVVPESSHIVAVTGKSGLLGFLGHRHAVVAPRWTADIRYDPEHPGRTRVDVTIDTAALTIDAPGSRELAGLSGDGPDPEDIETIRNKMLGDRYLDTEAHPEITFRTVAARYAYETLVVGGPLTIRGHSRDTNVALDVEPEGNGYRVTGTLGVRLSDYGIEPETVAGVVRVADEVEIRLDVLAAARGQERPATTR